MENLLAKLPIDAIPLSAIEITAIITGAFGLAALVILIASQYKLTKELMPTEEDDATAVTIVKVGPVMKLKRQINITWWIAAIGLCICILSTLTFVCYNSLALKYGAFNNVQLSQTIGQIKECTSKGFIEDTLPSDLKGNIIVYFKYGCPDCASIHDDIYNYLADKDTSRIYFVSSRSDQGKALLKEYPVDEVPSGIYIRSKESDVSNKYLEILYKKTPTEDGEITTFYAEGMDFLIERQVQGD